MVVEIDSVRCEITNTFYPHWTLRRVFLSASKSIIVHEPLAKATVSAVATGRLVEFIKTVRALKDIKGSEYHG